MVALICSEVVAGSSWDWRGVILGWQEPAGERMVFPQPRISLPAAPPAITLEDELEDAERWDGLS